jgi:plastocyanin
VVSLILVARCTAPRRCQPIGPGDRVQPSGGATTVEIANLKFGPDLTVPAGTTVTFTNKDTQLHTATEQTTRLINQLLHAHPEWVVDRLQIDARSGCSDFVGTAIVEGGGQSRVIQFAWDCRWRAEQEGWVDAFGFPDQIRAADEFGWNCFLRWQAEPAGAVARGSA